MLKIRGWNEFYEGWISQIFLQSLDTSRSADWQLGWKTAKETGPIAATVIPKEIELGHLIVDYEQ
jgi:hypothetical protein